ncbi:hypothetical protein BST22_05995 [Mycolicibacterium chubuense]|jgi:hypothetical protein|uniref:Uncharacterized protein n=1 Tax=Mycolicibacterium chubuense TaxID=1800 RepID=A0A0J6VWH2_MYCCU|nr:hypothetical protein [Mycolicibacterium chubuense]KMO73833.1 hypothetical protein MCHUDSM44219_03885 [Mycolicibacterium chubuense]ORA54941.1 hypothetical protein BST22_05995 [Mycolicibacterium chubuense]SPX97635.1 Uncharacterised protein [Mycolicibacterium chubuense]
MTFTRTLGASAIAGGIALAGLLSAGSGVAGAEPGGPCDRPGAPACQPAPQPNGDWQHRGIDQGRQDHQPFQYNGQQVRPLPAGNGDGWGFWFLGRWIRL